MHASRSGWTVLCLGLLASATAVDAALAETPPATMIVLDGSGSMGGPLEGQKEVKFDLAVAALNQSLAVASPTARLGLVMFGHRRRGNCSDVEVVVPAVAGPPERITTPLETIGTVGKGPVALALKEAAAALGPRTTGSLILIHDHPDNCRMDQCAVAAEIAKSNPGLAIHTISITLDPAVTQAMACVAKTTGGRQFEARDAASLNTAVGEAVKLANLNAPALVSPPIAVKPPPRPESQPNDGPSELRASAALIADGPPLTEKIAWRVTAADAPDKVVLSVTSPEISAPLPPGKYLVEANLGLVTTRQEVEVAEKGATTLRLGLGAGTLKISAKAHRSGDPLAEPLITVAAAEHGTAGDTRAGDTLWLGRDPETELVLPAGSYVVRVADGLAVKEVTVPIAAGKSAAADFVMGTGRLELAAVTHDGGQPVDGVIFLIEEDDPDAPQGRREVVRSAMINPDFTLTAGTYYVTARLGAAEVHERIAIGTNDIIKRALPMGLARVSLSATHDPALAPAGTPVTYRFLRLEPEPREVARSREGAPDTYVPQGRYRIEARLGTLNIKAGTEIDLVAGQSAKVAFKLDAGEVTIRAPQSAGPSARWEVRDAGGQVVMRSGTAAGGPTHLAPGRYVVRAEAGERRSENAFDLKAGERRTVDVLSQ